MGQIVPQIGPDQRLLQLLDHGAVELALGDEVRDRAADRGRGALEAAGEAAGRTSPFFAGVGVDAVAFLGCPERPFNLAPSCRKTRSVKPGMTPEEMVSRLLYRDGLMLIIDKPAGLAVHKGPEGRKGGASIEDYFDALRFGLPRLPALAHRLDKETSGCLVLGRHRQGAGRPQSAVPQRQGRQDLLGRGRGRSGGDRGPHRHAARPARRHPRLVDEARSGRAAGGDRLEGDGPRPPRG